jgi:hypothetical protein
MARGNKWLVKIKLGINGLIVSRYIFVIAGSLADAVTAAETIQITQALLFDYTIMFRSLAVLDEDLNETPVSILAGYEHGLNMTTGYRYTNFTTVDEVTSPVELQPLLDDIANAGLSVKYAGNDGLTTVGDIKTAMVAMLGTPFTPVQETIISDLLDTIRLTEIQVAGSEVYGKAQEIAALFPQVLNHVVVQARGSDTGEFVNPRANVGT